MIDLHLDPAKNLITTRIAGQVSPAELAAALYRTIRDPRFASSMSGLIVALDSNAVPDPGSFALMKPILKVWVTQRCGARWALVVPTVDAKDRAEALLSDLRLGPSIRCFMSEGAAMAWLATAPVAPAPPPVRV
jgi:hypothetical protein